ncbi:MAG: S8 family serine peptidase [Theionarchaea archaeon]|nr:S8 family serine peptidase [Theionarchaea archaeon]MBU6999833.1 S8 family serine peptidase [Theionarchaea archaeon]MBU7021944.1 S8 family serine peptidase [Theionarchaea archaeon]MBU7035219.1 S8 family serine peptidase [Theionarchaea archaeon]MBU7040708.1 S8 family serine peptidase [Theionarchaea archaeon]
MKKIAAGILVICLLLSVSGVFAASPERVIIVFHDSPDVNLVGQYGQVHKTFHLIPAVVATLPDQAMKALSKNPHVKYIQPDYVTQYVAPLQMSISAEPLAQVLPWGVDRIDAELAWSTSTGAGVKVAIVDTGIDRDHPDLVANIKGGFNAIAPRGRYKDPSDFDDDHGHGTHCAGIVAAVNNDIGVVGVAPDAWLYGVKVLSKSGTGQTSDCIEGIQWCADNGMDVISMSWGSSTYDQALNDACQAAWDAGCVLVSSAGNSGVETPDGYPSAYSSVMAISATDSSDNIASWSNYGDEIELGAPGVSVYSTYMGGEYATMSGTSMACPHVSGVAALVLAAHPAYSNQQVRQTLWNTAEDIGAPGWDIYFGYGLVDAQAAVV